MDDVKTSAVVFVVPVFDAKTHVRGLNKRRPEWKRQRHKSMT